MGTKSEGGRLIEKMRFQLTLRSTVDVTRGDTLPSPPPPAPPVAADSFPSSRTPEWRRSLSSPSHAPQCADPSRHVRRPSQVKCRPWRNDVSCTSLLCFLFGLYLGSLWVFGLSVLALNLNLYFLGAVSRSCTWLEWCWCWVLRVAVTRQMW